MKMLKSLVIIAGLSISSVSFAQDPSSAGGAPISGADSSQSQVKPKPKPARKYRRSRYIEKKAEGTKAKKRGIRPDTIKSQYRLNGRRLDVDPD